MNDYTSSTYGDRIASVYDGFYGPTDVNERVDVMEELASGGRAIELGVGTGYTHFRLRLEAWRSTA